MTTPQEDFKACLCAAVDEYFENFEKNTNKAWNCAFGIKLIGLALQDDAWNRIDAAAAKLQVNPQSRRERVSDMDANEELSRAIDDHAGRKTEVLFEKLVVVNIKSKANQYAELFKDMATGIAAVCFAAAIMAGILK